MQSAHALSEQCACATANYNELTWKKAATNHCTLDRGCSLLLRRLSSRHARFRDI